MPHTHSEIQRLLGKRQSVICCNKKGELADRAKYGASRCDGYSFCHSMAKILANGLYQYVADGSVHIKREDWGTIEKHADAIMAFSEADSWDEIYHDTKVQRAYAEKEQAFKETMSWLADNWQGLWW